MRCLTLILIVFLASILFGVSARKHQGRWFRLKRGTLVEDKDVKNDDPSGSVDVTNLNFIYHDENAKEKKVGTQGRLKRGPSRTRLLLKKQHLERDDK